MFVVVAYRWGWVNCSWYIHGVFAELNDAVNAADEECQGRGGKYGLAVEKQPEGEVVAYFPSTYGEAKPTCNRRIAAAERIGLRILDAVHDGETLLPKKDGSNYCDMQKVEVPQWVHDQVKDIEAIEEILCPDDGTRERAVKLEAALLRILAEPDGCPFCDSGKLRTPGNPAKGHNGECGFFMAQKALGIVPCEQTT